MYKILLESQLPVKEKPIAYTKWEKCLKKDIMHTLTCIKQTLFFTFNYLELYTTTKVKHHPIFLSIYFFTSILLKQ